MALLFWLKDGHFVSISMHEKAPPGPVLYVLPILILTLCDAASALVGSRYGKRIFRIEEGSKSIEGVVVFAVGKSTANADKVACQTERASLITAHKAAVTSNKVNATTDQETWADYLENPSLKYFATPTATYTGTPTMTAARTTQGGTIADCTAISV